MNNRMKNLINNSNEITVLKAKLFSFYKRVLVLKVPFGRNAAAYGVIFMGNKVTNPETVKHEYGHILQLKNLGLIKFTTKVAIPSLTCNILQRMDKLPFDYYGSPWEHEANLLGNVNGKKYTIWENGFYNNYCDLIKLFFVKKI